MIGRYIFAIVVAFVSSIIGISILVLLLIQCDNVPGWGLFLAACLSGLSTSLTGVVCGTVVLPRTEWKRGSKWLWFAGMIFSFLLLFFTAYFLPGLFLGGFAAWKIFQRLGERPADRRVGLLIFAMVAGVFICSFVTLGIMDAAGTMTKEKALKLISQAGGMTEVESESAAIFSQMKTNTDSIDFFETERTNFPALYKLGRWVTWERPQGALPERVHIRYGGHFHGGLYWIYPADFNVGRLTPEGQADFKESTSHCFQLTNNIFVLDFSK